MKLKTKGKPAFPIRSSTPDATRNTRVIESMTHLVIHGRTIRIWRDEKYLQDVDNTDILVHAEKLRASYATGMRSPSDAELLMAFEGFPRVAAVEVLDENKNGLLVYPSWP